MQVAAFFVMDTLNLDGEETARKLSVLGMMSMAMATLVAQLVVIPRTAMSVRGLLTMGIIVTMLGIALLLLPMSSGLFVFALTLKGFGMGLMRPAVAAGGSLAVSPDEQGAVAGLGGSTAAVGIIFLVPIIAMPLSLVCSRPARSGLRWR